MIGNPWKGLVSYVEADIDTYQFCGRTKAIGKYYSLLTNSLISTLYGRTGCGKTSMLQAGIFPLLRQESFFPVMCRASLRKAGDSFADYLIERIEQEIDQRGLWYSKSDVPVDQLENIDKYKLWKYFYGNEFKDASGNVVFPVIVLDQFEEILIDSKDDALKLLEQIHILVGDDLLLPDDCYANFRVALSLREDYLYLLEDTIESGKLYSLRDNRMRLSPLSQEEASEVISLGDDFMIESDRDGIYNTILRLSGNKRGHVSTNMLSLICSQIYQLYDSRDSKAKLSVQDVEILAKDPLKDFYLKCIDGVREETISYIEKNLVNLGRRNLVTIDSFKANVPDESERRKLTTGNTKILQIIVASDNECVELIHDTLARTVFRVAEGRRKISQNQKFFLIAESVIVAVLSGCFAIDMIITHSSVSATMFFVIMLLLNWLFSVSSYGNKNISNWSYFILFIISTCVSTVCFAEMPSEDGFWFYMKLLGLAYACLIPIINLSRKSAVGTKLDIRKSIKYILGFNALDDNKELFNICIIPLCITSSIIIGSICGFFISSVGLWLLLPSCSILCSYLLYKYFDNNAHFRNVLSSSVILLILTLFFVIIQHTIKFKVLLNLLVLFAFMAWAVSYARLFTSASVKRKIMVVCSQFVICGFFLPILFLGYNPLQYQFRNLARNVRQPEIVSEIRVPLIALHNAEGFNALADRHQLIFEADFMQIDSVIYDYYKWDTQTDHFDYDVLESHWAFPDMSEQNITLFTISGTYDWNRRYSSRSNSQYLRDRISVLETMGCNDWTEDEFSKLAELSAAYMTVGDTIKAQSLEINYFLRRMIQAEIYQSVDGEFSANSETCKDIIDYYAHSRIDRNFKGNYTAAFKVFADSCSVLRNRVNGYLTNFRTSSDLLLSNSLSFKDMAEVNVDLLKEQLESYLVSTVSHKWVNDALSQSDDMLHQTRESLGCFVVDELYIANYENEFQKDYRYNVSCAWFNLFLSRFSVAEDYARKSIEFMPQKGWTDTLAFPPVYYSNLPYTNLITSLLLQGKTDEALEILDETKDSMAAKSAGDYYQYLFPLQASGYEISVGEALCQDINRFMQCGIIRDSTTADLRLFREALEFESSLVTDAGHICYSEGWRLWVKDDSIYQLINEDEQTLPLFESIDVNIRDSIAICRLRSDSYRFLDLRNMNFIGDEYDYAWHFCEGLAAIEINGLIGFINMLGEVEIEPEYKTEDWLRKDHYRLAFHNDMVAITNDNLFYEFKDKNGNTVWQNRTLPYVKWNGNGLIVKTRVDGNEWVTATPDEGYIRKEFNAEFDDIVVNKEQSDTIPIYNHYDVTDIRSAEAVPDTDVSGIWYCLEKDSFLYLGKQTSDYRWIGSISDSGQYFLSFARDGETSIQMLPRNLASRKYDISISDDVCYILIDDTVYTFTRIKKL